MKFLITFGLVLGFLPTPLSADAAEPAAQDLQEPWNSRYTQENATAKHVLGLWTFDGPMPGADLSGHDLNASFAGTEIEPQGRFGAALRSFPGFPVIDERHWAMVPDSPYLSPRGAFTLEMWIKPEKDIEKAANAYLLDKKYVSDTDYQLLFTAAGRTGSRILKAVLGFGNKSETWLSNPLQLEPETWYHVAFQYNGAGRGRFLINGIPWGAKTVNDVGAIAAGSRYLTIGDRSGSNYGGFPGLIDQVRISEGELEFRPVRFEQISERSCFIRMEPERVLAFEVTNL